MMYKKEKSLALKGSTSAVSNNLSVLVNLEKGLINYAVAHKSVVNLVSALTDGSMANHRQIVCKEPSATTHGNTIVLQTRLISLSNRTILIITSQKGIQMFEADGSVMLYWYALGDVSQTEVASFGRGICGVQEDTICVGNHEGHILVFDIPQRGSNITLSETLRGHTSAVCDLESEGSQMVSSDEMGNIIVWRLAGDSFQQAVKINGAGWPCASLGLWNGLVIGGYGTGHLRVFSASTGKLHCQAAAHAKWINAVDVAKNTGMILTAGEDSFVRVWQLKPGENPELEHKHSESVTDQQLQGAKFISNDGRAFGCTGYDNNEITFFTQA